MAETFSTVHRQDACAWPNHKQIYPVIFRIFWHLEMYVLYRTCHPRDFENFLPSRVHVCGRKTRNLRFLRTKVRTAPVVFRHSAHFCCAIVQLCYAIVQQGDFPLAPSAVRAILFLVSLSLAMSKRAIRTHAELIAKRLITAISTSTIIIKTNTTGASGEGRNS